MNSHQCFGSRGDDYVPIPVSFFFFCDFLVIRYDKCHELFEVYDWMYSDFMFVCKFNF